MGTHAGSGAQAAAPRPHTQRRARGGDTRQLAWAKEFAQAGDLASALDALGDAGALAQELGREVDAAAIAGL